MCKLIRLAYLLIPISGFRAFLIRKHFHSCSSCQREWGMDQDMEEFFSKPDWITQEQSLWPRIQEKILAVGRKETRSKKRKKPSPFPALRWAMVGLVILILVGIAFLLRNNRMLESQMTENTLAFKDTPIHIIHAEIQGKKAVPYIYQGSENVFIWFGEIHQEED